MNFKKWTTALMLALAVSSCIQDEALNSEAAIDACTGADVIPSPAASRSDLRCPGP